MLAASPGHSRRRRPAGGLVFFHNFLLGIGTVLVYVSATVLLLENDPERSLPLTYGVAALAMVAAGRLQGSSQKTENIAR